jgi:ABC-type nitrate/sulfonate/bicarbonate transport system substrate-binding protein
MHEGSCLCDAVVFEITGTFPPPDACHRSQYRKRSGHCFAASDVPRSASTIHGGEKVTEFASSELRGASHPSFERRGRRSGCPERKNRLGRTARAGRDLSAGNRRDRRGTGSSIEHASPAPHASFTPAEREPCAGSRTLKLIGSVVRALAAVWLAFWVMISPASTAWAGEEPPPVPTPVRLAAPYFSLPVAVANAQGFFEEENLAVTYSIFSGSRQAFLMLSTGEVDVILSSSDNPVNYRLNSGNPLGAVLDVQIIFGHDLAFDLSLVGQPGFTTVESLRGARLAVDAPDSGFALALYKILRHYGMEAGVDYTVVSAGATPIRLTGLRAGDFEATVLNSDSLVRAESEGFPVLAALADIASPYAGASGIARESWLQANRDVAVRVIRAIYRANRWVRDPDNHAAAVDLIIADDPATTPALAESIYRISVDDGGVIGNARMSLDGLRTVLEIRQEFSGFETPQDLEALLTPEGGLYDLSYYEEAVRSLNAEQCRHHGPGHQHDGHAP